MVYASLWDRLVANIVIDLECWTWIGPKRRHGGGHRPAVAMRVPGLPHPRQYNACRVMCELVHGPAPTPEHEASHQCDDNWCCVNPDHLMWETKQENMDRMWAKRRAERALEDAWLGIGGQASKTAEAPF